MFLGGCCEKRSNDSNETVSRSSSAHLTACGTLDCWSRVENCGCAEPYGPSDDHHETLHSRTVLLQIALIAVASGTTAPPQVMDAEARAEAESQRSNRAGRGVAWATANNGMTWPRHRGWRDSS